MKKFIWRLQKVLDINQKREKAERAKLFEVTEQLALARTQLLAQQRILQDVINQVAKDDTTQRLNKQELLLKSTKTNDSIIKNIKENITLLNEKKRKITEEFLKLKRSNEAMEKLRQKAKLEYISEQEKLMQKEMDEHTGIRFARKIAQHN